MPVCVFFLSRITTEYLLDNKLAAVLCCQKLILNPKKIQLLKNLHLIAG